MSQPALQNRYSADSAADLVEPAAKSKAEACYRVSYAARGSGLCNVIKQVLADGITAGSGSGLARMRCNNADADMQKCMES